jgi:flagellar biosynthesis protein FlhB
MADEDKTEEPTGKKRQDSYSEGQFAKAPEINTAMVLFATVIILAVLTPRKAAEISVFTRNILGHLHEIEVNPEGIVRTLLTFGQFVVSFVLPLVIVSFIMALLAEGLQTRFRLTLKAFGVKFNRLNPINGIKRIFGKDALVAFFVDLLKFSAVAAVIYLSVRDIVSHPIFTTMIPPQQVGMFIHHLFILILFRLFLMISFIAVINYMYQRHSNHQKMKMTKQEVKEEQKSQEVDSHVKSAQRSMAMRLMRNQMLDEVPTADVVVTNPTHFAVALKYERGKDSAPVVIAKGAGAFAMRIKALAEEHDVPMVENKPIARMLHKVGNVGELIPVELYQVIAEILAHVYRAHSYYFHRLKARRLSAASVSSR